MVDIQALERRQDNRGSSLVMVMVIVSFLGVLLMGAYTLNTNARALAARSNESMDTTLAADAAMQHLYGILQSSLAQPDTFPSNAGFAKLSQTFNTNNAPTALLPAGRFKFLNYTVLPLGTNGVPTKEPDGTVVEGKQYRYLGVVWLQSLRNPGVVAKIQQEFHYTFKPLFQHAIFYDGDLELYNGPGMTIGGDVHANGAFYHSGGGSWTVQTTFRGKVTTAKGYSSNNFGYYAGTSRASPLSQDFVTTNTYYRQRGAGATLTSRKELPGVLSTTNTYGNPNISTNGAIQLIKRPVLGNVGGSNFTMYGTDPTFVDPYAPRQGLPSDHPDQVNTRMYYKAGLRILVESNGAAVRFFTGPVSDANVNGTEIPPFITNNVGGAPLITTNLTYQILSNATRQTRISDFRWNFNGGSNVAKEAITNVRAVQLDISKLIDSNGDILTNLTKTITTNLSGNEVPVTTPVDFNGIVYGAHLDGSSTNKTGFVLINGEKLPNRVFTDSGVVGSNLGMTFVSENSVYLVGDYNTGGKGGAVPSNSSGVAQRDPDYNLTNSTVGSYMRRPASILGDAVTIVSENYYGDNGTSGDMYEKKVYERVPSHTTVNTAIVTGNTPVTVSNGWTSGGAHNLPRFLENWTDWKNPKRSDDQKLVINGSLVCLYASEQAKDPFYVNIENAKHQEANAFVMCGIPSSLTNNYHQKFEDFYGPPVRVWNFDTYYLDPTKLPPGTPMVKVFTQGQWARVQ